MESSTSSSAIIVLSAETHIHSGVGQSTGALDLPVARERATHYPFVPGSGIKGAMRVWASEARVGLNGDINRLFGPEGQSQSDTGTDAGAGQLLCSDARLLLLPVRCLSQAYKWVTCPAILKRFIRDCDRARISSGIAAPKVEQGHYLGKAQGDEWLGLEEREVKHQGDIDLSLIKTLATATGEDEATLAARLAIIDDDTFTWFARFALPVMARNALNEDKIVKSGALWYEESLAPETIMYLLLAERKATAVTTVLSTMNKDGANYLQVGGNETIGQGWFRMARFMGA